MLVVVDQVPYHAQSPLPRYPGTILRVLELDPDEQFTAVALGNSDVCAGGTQMLSVGFISDCESELCCDLSSHSIALVITALLCVFACKRCPHSAPLHAGAS